MNIAFQQAIGRHPTPSSHWERATWISRQNQQYPQKQQYPPPNIYFPNLLFWKNVFLAGFEKVGWVRGVVGIWNINTTSKIFELLPFRSSIQVQCFKISQFWLKFIKSAPSELDFSVGGWPNRKFSMDYAITVC